MTSPAKGTYPRVRVSGSPLERGLAYGTLARGPIGLSVTRYASYFAHLADLDTVATRGTASGFVDYLDEVRPDHMAEIRGIAQGSGQHFLDILALNLRTELIFPHLGRRAFPGGRDPSVAECTVLGVREGHHRLDRTLLAQNWDWSPLARPSLVVLQARTSEGLEFTTLTEAGLLAKIGINNHGVGVTTNALAGAGDDARVGLPYHFLLRDVLLARTAVEAVHTLRSGPRSASAAFTVGDPSGDVFTVECRPGGREESALEGTGIRGYTCHTNHFRLLGEPGDDVLGFTNADSFARYLRAREGVAEDRGTLTTDTVTDVLRDHQGHPFSVCAHQVPDPGLHPHDQVETLASVVLDLTGTRMYLTNGAPCGAAYLETGVGPGNV